MRLLIVVSAFVLLLLAIGATVVGFMPMKPAVQHVEQRIPDAQIAR